MIGIALGGFLVLEGIAKLTSIDPLVHGILLIVLGLVAIFESRGAIYRG
jgi:hypothetical protein